MSLPLKILYDVCQQPKQRIWFDCLERTNRSATTLSFLPAQEQENAAPLHSGHDQL